MRIFAADWVRKIMDRLGMEEDIPIESKMVSRSIERAQKQVESRNFDIRKHLLEYDDVMNKQREAVYTLRRRILRGDEGRDYILRVVGDIVDMLVERDCSAEQDPEDWNTSAFELDYGKYFGIPFSSLKLDWASTNTEQLREAAQQQARQQYGQRVEQFGDEQFQRLEKYIMLSTLDRQWKDHLLALDHLREGIGLRAYGQRNPLVEYKRESFELFEAMWERIEDQVVTFLYHAEPVEEMTHRRHGRTIMSHPEARAMEAERQQQDQIASRPVGKGKPTTVRRAQPKVGRNEPCPCGSGKKYKSCCGR